MSYGVNRAKRTTRRKVRRQSSGRARAAGKRRSRATSTRRATSVRSARRKSGRRAKSRQSRSATRRTRGAKRTTSKSSKSRSRSRKPRTYVRYDPETGAKVRVTSDSFEYQNWLSRKPSRKRQARAALLSDPFGTTATAAQKAAIRAGERIVEHTAKSAIRRYGGAAVAAATTAAAEIGGAGLAVAALPIAAAIGGALLYYSTQPGAEENKLSLQFVAAQKTLMQQTRAATWQQVPEAARNRLLNDYKTSLRRIAEVRRATSLQTSNRYRKG